jgi:hypothetical protein
MDIVGKNLLIHLDKIHGHKHVVLDPFEYIHIPRDRYYKKLVQNWLHKYSMGMQHMLILEMMNRSLVDTDLVVDQLSYIRFPILNQNRSQVIYFSSIPNQQLVHLLQDKYHIVLRPIEGYTIL